MNLIIKKYFLLCAVFLAGYMLSSCDRNDDDSRDNLPEATQTGVGIFACYVDGKSFIDTSNGYFNCFYQNIDGEYYFGITGKDDDYEYTDTPCALIIRSVMKRLEEGKTYILDSSIEGNTYGTAFFSYHDGIFYDPSTSAEYTGELTITKLSNYYGKNVAAGTFWFNVEHPVTGDTVKITEGRFDTLYLD